MTAQDGTTASNEKTLIAATSTGRLVPCKTREIAELLRPVWAYDLPMSTGAEAEVPAQLDLSTVVHPIHR